MKTHTDSIDRAARSGGSRRAPGGLLRIAAAAALALFAAGAACAQSVAAQSAAGAPAVGHYADIDGLHLYYEVHGSGDGHSPPLLLLHGGGSTIASNFSKLLPLFAAQRQVIAFEQQGHGHTADVDRPFSFEQSADDAAALLRHLKIEQADVFGHSNGGTIALYLAMRHPQMVRKLIVASANYRRDGMIPGFFDGLRHASLQDMPDDLRQAYLRTAPHPQQLQSFFDKSRQRMLAFKDIPDQDIRAIASPALVVDGDSDVVLPEHALALFRLLPHARLAILPGTAHQAVTERSDWLVPMTTEFLDAPMPAAS